MSQAGGRAAVVHRRHRLSAKYYMDMRLPALLHYSGRGSQCTSEQFRKLIADHRIIRSMSRLGNVLDNAAMESIFSSLKTERTARKAYRSRDDAKATVFDFDFRTISQRETPTLDHRLQKPDEVRDARQD